MIQQQRVAALHVEQGLLGHGVKIGGDHQIVVGFAHDVGQVVVPRAGGFPLHLLLQEVIAFLRITGKPQVIQGEILLILQGMIRFKQVLPLLPIIIGEPCLPLDITGMAFLPLQEFLVPLRHQLLTAGNPGGDGRTGAQQKNIFG